MTSHHFFTFFNYKGRRVDNFKSNLFVPDENVLGKAWRNNTQHNNTPTIDTQLNDNRQNDTNQNDIHHNYAQQSRPHNALSVIL